MSVKAAAVAVYRGVDPDDPIVATAAGASPADGVTIPSLDAASPGDRLVTFGGATHLIPGTNTWTTPEAMRVRGTTNSGTVTAIIAEQDLPAPGPTGTRTFGYTTNGSIIAAGIILRRPPTPERWHHHDQLGSTRALTDETGAKVGTATYDPYGAPTATTGETARLGFAGEYTDPSTGLLYLRARWYDPDTGQFLTRDPLEVLTREAYSYAGNDPINNTDPLGLFCVGPLCTPSADDVKDAVGGVVDTVADATRDVADLAYRNRHNIGTAVGVAACLSTSGVACAGGLAIGVLTRSSKRIEEVGWDASFKENVFDATITTATFGLVRVPGKFALGREGMRDISIFNRASSFPLWQRLEIIALRGTVGASQLVGRFGC